jgi:alkylation response protein AidB-like acyl-CoA dehydrogenase
MEREQAERATLYALDTSIRVAESAIQVHGGMGFTWEMGLHFYLRAMLTQRELVTGLWAGTRS